jgi:catechol 2,3-dioxygenase-like lactoylglutathione lyase family enzyme
VPAGPVDHLWIRVRDPQTSRRFYTTIAPHAGLRLAHDEPGRVQLAGPDYSFSLVRYERPLTEHVHFAFPAREDATMRAFHAVALTAGYEDNGAPAELHRLPPRLLRRLGARPGRAQHRGRQPQPRLSRRRQTRATTSRRRSNTSA